MRLIILAYGVLKETIAAVMIVYKITKLKVQSDVFDTAKVKIISYNYLSWNIIQSKSLLLWSI